MIDKNIIPATGPESLGHVSPLLDRRARLDEAEKRLAGEAVAAKAAIAKLHEALEQADGKHAVANADGDEKAYRAAATLCDRLRRELGEAEEALAQKERGRRGLTKERASVDDEIAAAYPALRAVLSALRSRSLAGLRDALRHAIRGGAPPLIDVVRAAGMLRDVLGVPNHDWFEHLRVPDPISGVEPLPQAFPGFCIGPDVRARWLLQGTKADPASSGDCEGRLEDLDWRTDKTLLALSETLRAYAVAAAQSATIHAAVLDRRALAEEEARRAEAAARQATRHAETWSGFDR